MNAVATTNQDFSVLEQVVIQGRLENLTAEDRVSYYKQVCQSVGLNPLTKPFEYITLNGKLTLYATRGCTDQLRKLNGVSVKIVARENVEGVYVVTANATDKTGREDEAIGAIVIAGLKGEALANAIMKAETKAKRRVTMSICGLGFLDESEVEGAQAAPFSNAGISAPAIEDSIERREIIKRLEGVKLEQGLEALQAEWKDRLTKQQRQMVGGQELERIKSLVAVEVSHD